MPTNVRIYLTGLIAFVKNYQAQPDGTKKLVSTTALLVDARNDFHHQHWPYLFYRDVHGQWKNGGSIERKRLVFNSITPDHQGDRGAGPFADLPQDRVQSADLHWLPRLRDLLGSDTKIKPETLRYPDGLNGGVTDAAVVAQVELQKGVLRTYWLAETPVGIVPIDFGPFRRAASAILVLEGELPTGSGDQLVYKEHSLDQASSTPGQDPVIPSYKLGKDRYVEVLISNSSTYGWGGVNIAHHFPLFGQLFKPAASLVLPENHASVGADPALQPGNAGFYDLPPGLRPPMSELQMQEEHTHSPRAGGVLDRPICPMVEAEGP